MSEQPFVRSGALVAGRASDGPGPVGAGALPGAPSGVPPRGRPPVAGSRLRGAGGRPPGVVRAATVAWVAAVAAGVVEAAGTVVVWASGDLPELSGGSLAAGLGIRAAVYTVVLLVVAAFWRGKNWARIALALGLGVVGMLSLVAEPIGWLADGHSLGDALSEASLSLALVIAIRTLHVVAVLAGLVLMFRPAANQYFRRTGRP
jgi:hypothetical protein